LDGTIANFTSFADEVVCATIPSEDDTHERLLAWQEKLGVDRFKVVMTDIKLSNNRFDGDLKTAALQACTKSTPVSPRVFIIADADERFPLSNKPRWVNAAYQLTRMVEDGFFIPVLDLYGSEKQIRADQTIGNKFRMHGPSITKRGVIPGAEYGNGLFNTALSDSTEPIDSYGQLGLFAHIVDNPRLLNPHCAGALVDFPHVLHYGHLDVARRVKLNNEFWREHWEKRSGKTENLAKNEDELRHIPLVEHGLPLT
jgi:hypothetical protein